MGDNLRLLPIIEATVSEQSIFPHLFDGYSGHITLPTNLLFVVLAEFFSFNVKVGLWFNFLVACSTFVLLLVLTKRKDVLLVAPLLSLLFFSVTQDLTWLSVYFGHWLNVLFFVTLTLWLMQLQRDWAFGLWLFTGFMATFSMGNGFIVWLSLIPLIITYYRSDRVKIAIYSLTSVACVAAYFLLLPSTQSSLILLSPSEFMAFVSMLLGAPFVSRLYVGSYLNLFSVAYVIGLVGMLWLIVNVAILARKGDIRDYPELIGLGLFVLGSVVLVAVARGDSGALGSITFRGWYHTLSLWFWFILVVTSWIVLRDLVHSKPLLIGNSLLVSCLIFLFVMQNARIAETSYITDVPDNPAGAPITEACAKNIVFKISNCAGRSGRLVFQASHRLAVYADLQPRNVIAHNPHPAIIDVKYEWQAVALRDWLLSGAEVHTISVEETTVLEVSPQIDDFTALHSVLPNTFWYACTPEQCNTFSNYTINEEVDVSDYVELKLYQRQ